MDAAHVLIRRVVPSDAEAIARVHLLGWQSTYRGLMPDEFLDRLRLDERTAMWCERLSAPPAHATGFVADSKDSGVTGFVYGGPPREPEHGLDRELALIYLHPNRQRIGLGRKLFHAFASACFDQGANGFYLYVLDGNPAIHFYERLGGVRQGESFREFGGKRLRELRYMWRRECAYEN